MTRKEYLAKAYISGEWYAKQPDEARISLSYKELRDEIYYACVESYDMFKRDAIEAVKDNFMKGPLCIYEALELLGEDAFMEELKKLGDEEVAIWRV